MILLTVSSTAAAVVLWLGSRRKMRVEPVEVKKVLGWVLARFSGEGGYAAGRDSWSPEVYVCPWPVGVRPKNAKNR